MDKRGIKTSTLFRFTYVFLLIFLYIAATTDLVIKEKTKIVYPVAFLTGDTFEEYGENMKKGMDAASEEFNVDMSLLVASKEMKPEEKIELMKGEIELGAKAILIGEEEKDALHSALETLSRDIPVIVIGERAGFENLSNVYVDVVEIAELLAEHIIEKYEKGREVVFVTSKEGDLNENSIVNHVIERLKEGGFPSFCESWDGEVKRAYEDKVIVTMNKKITTAFVKQLEERGKGEERFNLYGIGSTTFLLNKVDTGVLSGLIAWDDFALGYVAVESAVGQIKFPAGRKRERIECFFLDKEILDSGRYMKLLYQIN